MAGRAPAGGLATGLRGLNSRRDMLAGGVLAAAAIAAEALRVRSVKAPMVSGDRLEQLVPSRVGGWARASFAEASVPTAEASQRGSYDAVLTRFYESRSGPGIMLLIAYSAVQAGETALHRPEACYPAFGFQLKRRADLQLSFRHVRLMASSMTATAPGRVEQLLYWSRIGALFPTTPLDQRWAALKQSVAGGVPDGALLRISMVETDYRWALSNLQHFASQLLLEGGPRLRLLLTGRA
jgi:EpsI family protein